jgi:hypothetical protein
VAVIDLEGGQDTSMGLFANLETLELARLFSRSKGVLEGRDLERAFAWLRPNDLIWAYWVNNYLLGQEPPAFDILSGTLTPPICRPRCTETCWLLSGWNDGQRRPHRIMPSTAQHHLRHLRRAAKPTTSRPGRCYLTTAARGNGVRAQPVGPSSR